MSQIVEAIDAEIAETDERLEVMIAEVDEIRARMTSLGSLRAEAIALNGGGRRAYR